MGEVSRILVTGASGFVGSAIVAEARKRGHEVIAVYRSVPRAIWSKDRGIVARQIDLSLETCLPDLAAALSGVDAVIHAAAHVGSDAGVHDRITLPATRLLLRALKNNPAVLVLVSSLSVYDTMQLPAGAVLDETAPLVTRETARDAYAAAKLAQEEMVIGARSAAWLMRAGLIWGPGQSWHAHQGLAVGPLLVTINSAGELPLVHVKSVARALLDAALTQPNGIQALNVVDDDRPNRKRFLKAYRRAYGWPKVNLSIAYPAWLAVVRVLGPFADKLPGLLREPALRARLMPLSYPNTALRDALGGADTAPFEDVLQRTKEAE